MTSPNIHHGHPDPDPDLHSPAPSSPQPQRSYQPQAPESSSPPSESHSPQTTHLHLPTSRQFLTSLITAISNIPLLNELPAAPAPVPTKRQQQNPSTTATEPEAGPETQTARRKQLLQILKEEGEEKEEVTTKTKKNGGRDQKDRNVNPLKLVPPEYRHLIITLHVLFPGVVLPGLEVLERGLVERVVLRSASSGTSGKGDGDRREGTRTVGEVKEEQEAKGDADVVMGERDEDMNRDHDGDEKQDMNQDGEENVDNKNLKPILNKSQKASKAKGRRPPQFYLVRSSQFLNTTHPRRKRKNPSSNLSGLHGDADTEGIPSGVGETDRDHRMQIQRYIVSLEAWNCTCAAFAFACVSEPAAGEGEREGGVKELREGIEELRARERERDKVGSAGWTFGGMTLFDAGDHSSVPPVCKHLLACLLADKWRVALGRYVAERMVSREEMAGIVADV